MKNQSSNIRNSLIIRIFEFSKIGFGSEAEPKNSFFVHTSLTFPLSLSIRKQRYNHERIYNHQEFGST